MNLKNLFKKKEEEQSPPTPFGVTLSLIAPWDDNRVHVFYFKGTREEQNEYKTKMIVEKGYLQMPSGTFYAI